jgi:SAM-dependent methyltransferase
MTAGDHFERAAAAYESLRTTDEAPVRAIGQLLPGRPVTGLDIGCGTGRYTRLLGGLLPDGSLLVAADVSAATLAQLRAASRGHTRGWSRCWRPPKSCRCGPPAWNARTIWGRYFPGFTEHEQRYTRRSS